MPLLEEQDWSQGSMRLALSDRGLRRLRSGRLQPLPLCSYPPLFTSKPFPPSQPTGDPALSVRALPPSCSDSSWTDVVHLGSSLPSRALSFWEHGLRLPAHTHLSQLAELTRDLHCFKRILMRPCPLQLLTAFSIFRRQLLHGHTQGAPGIAVFGPWYPTSLGHGS